MIKSRLALALTASSMGIYLFAKCYSLNKVHTNMDGDGTSLSLFGMEINDKLSYAAIPQTMTILAFLASLLVVISSVGFAQVIRRR